MATLVWDKVGDRQFQLGVDRGVIYFQDGVVVPWNGLIGIEESFNSELKSFYLDGVKYLETLTPSDYLGKIKAYTYPDEFDLVTGIARFAPGFAFYEQPLKSFNLCYRTRIGNDLKGPDFGYKIHILYNVLANPDSQAFDTLQDSNVSPVQFSWNLTGTPPKIDQVRPTVHISIDSTDTPPEVLFALESILYGTDKTAPSLPAITDVAEFFGYRGALLIIDHGDGTWTAIDESDTYLTMTDPTTFLIDGADITYLDPETYKVSSTNVGQEI